MTNSPKSSVDAADLALIPTATAFTASLFLGTGKYAKKEELTLTGARRAGSILVGVHTNGRTPLIYATVGARQILVPDDYQLPTTLTKVTKEPAMPAKTEIAPKKKAKKVATAKKAAPAKKTAKAPRPAKERPLGARAAVEAAARAGKLPEPPDFSAETHKRFRGKLEEVLALAKAKDVKGLKAFSIKPVSTSPKAIARYRDLCVLALEAKAA